jgi:branched-chain amino acid transport system ATP-binding protein
MLELDALEVNIGSASILRQVDLSIPVGALSGLIGRNGAGKTTLMRCVMGLLDAKGGGIRVGGKSLTGVPAHGRAGLGIGYMPEDRRLIPDFTVEENVLVPAWAGKQQDTAARLDWVFGLMPEVREFRTRRASQLSGGQQKLVALARALMAGRKLLLLDEPFEGVAPALAQRLAEVLSDLKGSGITVLVADSNEKHIADLLTTMHVIERGAIRKASG